MDNADYIRSRNRISSECLRAKATPCNGTGPGWHWTALCMLALIAQIVFFAPEAIAAGSAKNKDIRLKIYDARVSGTAMTLTYEVKNIGNAVLWICVGNNDQSMQAYETITSSKKNMLRIIIKSATIPEGHVPDMPLMGRYKKLPPGHSITFSLGLKSPVTDFSPIGGHGSGKIELRDINTVELVLGYFRTDLEGQQKCCMPGMKTSEIFVDSLWSAKNNEDTLSLTISRKRRWK